MSANTLRIALCGLPGAGKSTSAALLQQSLQRLGEVRVLKLAAPLYDIQESFYRRMGSRLAAGQQDGTLLNSLGTHFRHIDSGFLLEDFEERCAFVQLCGADIVLSDDARPVDLPGLVDRGFIIIRVSADARIRRERKAGRGDRTAGDDDHATEKGIELVEPDFEIENSGSREELASQIARLTQSLSTWPRASDAAVARRRHLAIERIVQRAANLVSQGFVEGSHQIAATIVDGRGHAYSGLHLEAMVGRASICAEAVALGNACAAGADDLRVVVAVRHPKSAETVQDIRVVPPCGLCREILLDYGKEMKVVVDAEGELQLVPLVDLLPNKYVGTKWGPGGLRHQTLRST